MFQHVRKKRADERKRSGNTTPPPTPVAVEEEIPSDAMEEESSSGERSSESIKTKETVPSDAYSTRVVTANGSGDLTVTEGDDFTVVTHKKKSCFHRYRCKPKYNLTAQ
ncbi:hypothetical protein TNCV_2659631 [Trichonephila clavipes]|uniref:Uncharacterized protein n=1 Tax=Trichonephila clavipes TaxID=2585209 RepID=A0A8X6R9V4_TRICX|nr:hypothetical protein TNCV_2659631 [Trichonephila clavipes]